MKGSLDELLARYAEAAAEHRAALKDASSHRANRSADVNAKVYAELRERGPEARNA